MVCIKGSASEKACAGFGKIKDATQPAPAVVRAALRYGWMTIPPSLPLAFPERRIRIRKKAGFGLMMVRKKRKGGGGRGMSTSKYEQVLRGRLTTIPPSLPAPSAGPKMTESFNERERPAAYCSGHAGERKSGPRAESDRGVRFGEG